MRPLVLVVLTLVASTASAQTTDRSRAGATRVSYSTQTSAVTTLALPALFTKTEVETQLDSGLSTTLVASLEVTGDTGKRTTHARARIRYDLWDEIFHVDSVGFGNDGSFNFKSRSQLSSWWRECSMTLNSVTSRPRSARVRLVVLPFSASEENDARLWFSRSVRGAGTSSAQDSGGELNTLLERVMATAIRREQLLSYDLRLEIQDE